MDFVVFACSLIKWLSFEHLLELQEMCQLSLQMSSYDILHFRKGLGLFPIVEPNPDSHCDADSTHFIQIIDISINVSQECIKRMRKGSGIIAESHSTDNLKWAYMCAPILVELVITFK